MAREGAGTPAPKCGRDVEFRAEAVKLANESGKTLQTLALELELSESALRKWISQAKVNEGGGLVGQLTTIGHRPFSRRVLGLGD